MNRTLEMGLILCIAGFASVALLIRRSFGDGLGLLLAIGSVYGIARCVIFDGFTHFLFDASVLGAYVGGVRRIHETGSFERTGLRSWLLLLGTLPSFSSWSARFSTLSHCWFSCWVFDPLFFPPDLVARRIRNGE